MNIQALMSCAVVAASSVLTANATAQPIADSFTYQGTLTAENTALNGLFDIGFTLYDAPIDGNELAGGPVIVNNVQVTNGLFEAFVDFGSATQVFDSNQTRWLEIRIQPSGGGLSETLSPRQRIAPAPVANYALNTGAGLDEILKNGNTFEGTQDNSSIFLNTNDLVNAGYYVMGAPEFSRRAYLINNADNAGELRLFNEVGASNIRALNDDSFGGGGYLFVARNDIAGAGIILDGNSLSTERPRLLLSGPSGSDTIDFNLRFFGDLSVRLPTGAINSEEILDEPGAAEFISNNVTILDDSNPAPEVASIVTIDCPDDGFVLVFSSNEVSVLHNNGTTSSVNIGVSNSDTMFQSNTDLELRIDQNIPTGNYDYPITTHALFPVTEGSNTFYLLADKNFSGGLAQLFDTQLTAIYLPTSYGNIARNTQAPALPDELVPITPTMSELDIIREQNAAIIANNQRLERELQKVQAQMQEIYNQAQREHQAQDQD